MKRDLKTEIGRVKHLCKYLIYKGYAENDSELAALLGYTRSSFSQFLNEKKPITDNFINKISSLDSNVNKLYIRQGGELLIMPSNHQTLDSTEELLPEDMENYKLSIPLIPVDAFAGVANNNGYAIDLDSIEERYIVPLFNKKGVDFMIQVRGASMYPKYSNGDIVACKFVRELIFIQWNKVYIIDTKSQGAMIKRLLPSKDPSYITCRSDNPDYLDFDIPLSEINNIALVIGSIRLE